MLQELLEAIKNKEPSKFGDTVNRILKEKALQKIQETRLSVMDELGFSSLVEDEDEVEDEKDKGEEEEEEEEGDEDGSDE